MHLLLFPFASITDMSHHNWFIQCLKLNPDILWMLGILVRFYCPLDTVKSSLGRRRDCLEMWEGPTHFGRCHPGQVVLICIRKLAEHIYTILSEPWLLCQFLSSVSCLGILPWLSSSMDYDLDELAKRNPFFPQIIFAHVIYHSNRKTN